jgi:hypothetical protein
MHNASTVETPKDLDVANVQSFGIQIDSMPEKSRDAKVAIQCKE